MGIGAALLLLAVAAEHGFKSLDVSTFYFLAVIAIIYVPPWETVPGVGRYARATIAMIIAFTYPFVWDKLFTVPIFGAFPSVPTGVVMLVFIMMAVGLNIVVGYAGLLDLGYVAFYATGAYTAAFFASQQFAGQKCPKPGVSVADCPVAAIPRHSFDFGAVGLVPGGGGI